MEQGKWPFLRKDNFMNHMRTVHADKPQNKFAIGKSKLEAPSINKDDSSYGRFPNTEITDITTPEGSSFE